MNDEKKRTQFWMALIPYWLLTQAALYLSAQIINPLIPGRWWPLLVVLAAIVFLVARFHELNQTVRLTSLLLFASLAGGLLVVITDISWQQSGRRAIIITVLTVTFSLLLGGHLPPLSRTFERMVHSLSWVYVAGWFLGWLQSNSDNWVRQWALLGGIIFPLLVAIWSKKITAADALPELSFAGGQLLLYSINLTLAILFLMDN